MSGAVGVNPVAEIQRHRERAGKIIYPQLDNLMIEVAERDDIPWSDVRDAFFQFRADELIGFHAVDGMAFCHLASDPIVTRLEAKAGEQA